MRILCPAKVNLFLAVGPRDRRGYHPLRTIFQAVDLCDVLTIQESEEPSVTCDWADLPTDNTLTKTLRLLYEVATLPPLDIRLEKRIPAQSGLGGGSSDAAGLLRAAKKIQPPLPDAQLHDIALAVGADVPFFLLGGRARGEGYGERLSPIEAYAPEWLVIAQPDVTCSTADAYARLDELSFEWRDFPTSSELYNDFERVAPGECLELIGRLKHLGARDAALTGSGSAVFGLYPNQHDAEQAAGALRAEYGNRVWTARMLDRQVDC